MNKDKLRTFTRIDAIILGVIILLAFVVRMYKYDTPLADFHSWRQVDTAAVARNYVKDGIDLMMPIYDDFSNIQSGTENPNGYRFVEFPLYNAAMAIMYNTFPQIALESWGRIISAVMSLFIIGVLYYIALKESSRITAVAAALTYSFFPYIVFFSRTVLPETPALAFAMIALLFAYFYINADSKVKTITFFTLSVLAFAIAILIKPTAIFYGLPIGFLFLRKWQFRAFKRPLPYIYFALAFIPFVLWRMYISQFPEGIPGNLWLITRVNTFEGQRVIFFRPAFFRWIFFERINILILGGYTTFLFLLGIFTKPKYYLLHMIGLAGFIYLFIFQGGNVQHEYYQTIFFPVIAIFTGLGVHTLVTNKKVFWHPALMYVAVTGILVVSILFSYYKVQDYYRHADDLVQIARIVRTLTSPDDKLVTDRLGDTTLLYLTDRKGSPALNKTPQEFRDQGYKYLVSNNQDTIKAMKEEQQLDVVFENDKFALFRL